MASSSKKSKKDFTSPMNGKKKAKVTGDEKDAVDSEEDSEPSEDDDDSSNNDEDDIGRGATISRGGSGSTTAQITVQGSKNTLKNIAITATSGKRAQPSGKSKRAEKRSVPKPVVDQFHNRALEWEGYSKYMPYHESAAQRRLTERLREPFCTDLTPEQEKAAENWTPADDDRKG